MVKQYKNTMAEDFRLESYELYKGQILEYGWYVDSV